MIHRLNTENERLLELIADRATVGLEEAEAMEARASLGDDFEDFSDVELAAAALDLAFMAEMGDEADEPLPTSARSAVLAATSSSATETKADVVARVGPQAATSGSWMALSGWAAAAAVALVAALMLVGRGGGEPPTWRAYQSFVANTTDVQRASWGDWSEPEITGVTGEVVWSESLQAGFMVFDNLPENDASAEEYQLWIVDKRGLADPETGVSERVSGGVFSHGDASVDPETGRLIVPIDPALQIQGGALFAVTIEAPGGVAVSDMSRRMTIASLTG